MHLCTLVLSSGFIKIVILKKKDGLLRLDRTAAQCDVVVVVVVVVGSWGRRAGRRGESEQNIAKIKATSEMEMDTMLRARSGG